jgi:hypothetical protein
MQLLLRGHKYLALKKAEYIYSVLKARNDDIWLEKL